MKVSTNVGDSLRPDRECSAQRLCRIDSGNARDYRQSRREEVKYVDRAAIHAFITRQRYGVVSSAAANGTPQSALVGIASTSRLEIIFDTIKNSRKYPNLIQRPACSMVVGWSGEQTLQLEGTAEEPKGSALREFQDAYFAEWPECREHVSWPDIAYFVIRPYWIRFSDYDQKPPLIDEFAIDDPLR